MSNTVNLFSVGEQWYYTLSPWKGTTGPFNTLQEASEAAIYELTNNNAKKEDNSYLTTTDEE